MLESMNRIMLRPGPWVLCLLLLIVAATGVTAALSYYRLAIGLGVGALLILGSLVVGARKLAPMS
jgi:hypothetical protein